MPLPAARPRRADLAGLALSATCLIHCLALSATCLIHCLALPMLLLLAPALGHWIALPEGTHAAILALALPAALVAMRGGWERHRRPAPGLVAAMGLVLLALGLAAHEGWIATANASAADTMLTTLGALALAAAHLANWRLGHGD